MLKQRSLAKIRQEKFRRLVEQVSAEYGGDNPVWLMDYCESIVFGNNQQFMKACDAMLELKAHAPTVMAAYGVPRDNVRSDEKQINITD